jgi:hypothetical protein
MLSIYAFIWYCWSPYYRKSLHLPVIINYFSLCFYNLFPDLKKIVVFGFNWLDKHLFLPKVTTVIHSLALVCVLLTVFSRRPILRSLQKWKYFSLPSDSENSRFDLLVWISYILLYMKMRMEGWWDSSNGEIPRYWDRNLHWCYFTRLISRRMTWHTSQDAAGKGQRLTVWSYDTPWCLGVCK